MSQFGRVKSGFVLAWGGAIALLVLATQPALASSRQERERAARKACLAGDYAKGIDILSDLFLETQDPVFIFNQARCLEQGQQYKDAIARFQEYLRTGETHRLKPDDEAAAKEHIVACKENLANQTIEAQAGTAPAPFTSPRPTPPPPAEQTSAAPIPASSVTQPEPQQAPASTRSGLRMAGIVTAAIGVAALGAGVAFNVLANNTAGDMESTLDGYATKKSTRDGYVALAWVGYGAGAACVVAGAVLYGIGRRTGSTSSTNVAFVPTFGSGQAGAALVGAF
jgi:tetratricopeptide (TPR) repeat protein